MEMPATSKDFRRFFCVPVALRSLGRCPRPRREPADSPLAAVASKRVTSSRSLADASGYGWIEPVAARIPSVFTSATSATSAVNSFPCTTLPRKLRVELRCCLVTLRTGTLTLSRLASSLPLESPADVPFDSPPRALLGVSGAAAESIAVVTCDRVGSGNNFVRRTVAPLRNDRAAVVGALLSGLSLDRRHAG